MSRPVSFHDAVQAELRALNRSGWEPRTGAVLALSLEGARLREATDRAARKHPEAHRAYLQANAELARMERDEERGLRPRGRR